MSETDTPHQARPGSQPPPTHGGGTAGRARHGAWADDAGPGTEGVASHAGTTMPRTGISATYEQHPERSLGELVGEVSRDLSNLLRQEVALAKAEMKESAQRAGKGAGMFGGAGVAGHMMLLFLSLALWWWLGSLLGYGWSALIVAAVWAVVAVVLAIRGRSALRGIEGMPQTAESVRKIPHALRGHEERNT